MLMMLYSRKRCEFWNELGLRGEGVGESFGRGDRHCGTLGKYMFLVRKGEQGRSLMYYVCDFDSCFRKEQSL
jgi:hypothetical protein